MTGVDYVIGETHAAATRACAELGLATAQPVAARNVLRAIEGTHRARVVLADPWIRVDLYNQVMATLRERSATIVALEELDR